LEIKRSRIWRDFLVWLPQVAGFRKAKLAKRKKAAVPIPVKVQQLFFWFKLNKTYDKERSVKLQPLSAI
jgi:hypothetical protein